MRRNKYNVAPKQARTVDGITFDSKAEMTRYLDLKILEKAGEITRRSQHSASSRPPP